MKRIYWTLVLRLCLLVYVLFIVSCSNTAPEGPTVVTIWNFGGVPGQRDWVKEAVAAFNARGGDIRIQLDFLDWATQRESLISTTIMAEGPDIIQVHHKYASEFGELGGLYALDDFADFPQVKAQFFANTLKQVEYEDKHYGLPVLMLPFVLAVNQEILDNHGLKIPRTWAEMKTMGEVLKAAGIHVFTMPASANLGNPYRFLPMLYKAGGRVLNEDMSKAIFNGPAGVEMLRFLVEMKEAGFFPEAAPAYSFDENAAHWSNQKAAISLEGPWWQDIVRDNYDFDTAKLTLAPVPVPVKPLEDRLPNTLLDVVMISITGYTKDPEAAWTVLKALWLEDPVWRVPDPSMGGLPTHKFAYNAGVESRYIDLAVLASEGQQALGWPGHPKITEIQRHMADAVNTALSGVMEPQAALDAAAAEVNEMLDDF